MPPRSTASRSRLGAAAAGLLLAVTGCATASPTTVPETPEDPPAARETPAPSVASPPPWSSAFDPLREGLDSGAEGDDPPEADSESDAGESSTLPGGRRTVFGDRSFLVAYYGTAGTGALGVLGETDIDTAHRRLVRAGRPFVGGRERLQPVYELIVTVADAHPGRDRDYSHHIDKERVRRYVRAAHRHGALVLLDVQPGRGHFLKAARHWEWALKDPWVGLALDPEWRMGRRQVPGRVIGSVGAREINRTSAWLARLVRRERLPQKLFVLHQFRTSMIRDIEQVAPRRGLAMVQHVDGFGTPQQKLATYHAVVKPAQFHLGLKLFYDEDRRLMPPRRVRAIRPPVRFVSYQ